MHGMPVWLALGVPSAFVVHRYAGWTGVLGYGLLLAGLSRLQGRPLDRFTLRQVASLALCSVAVLVVVFVVVHPLVDIQQPGVGSDDDEAHDLGARALLEGRSPYGETTYLGNVLHQLPGAFVLAIPFVVVGSSALQNLFWLVAFFVVRYRVTGDARRTLGFAWLVLAGSPAVLHGIVTGTAHVANAIYVALGLWWLAGTRRRRLAAVAWGVTLASRANFLVLLPLAVGWIWRRAGPRAAAEVGVLTAATTIGLTLPFYAHDPAAFGPLEAADRLSRLDAALPYAGLGVGVAMVGLALTLGTRPLDRIGLFRACAAVQAVPVVAGLALTTVAFGQPDLLYAAYGTFAAWFAFIGWGFERATSEP